MVEAERFIKGYEDSTTNVDFDKDKEERYNKNLHVLKLIVPVIKLCTEQDLPLTLLWVGFLEVRFEVREGGVKLSPLSEIR